MMQIDDSILVTTDEEWQELRRIQQQLFIAQRRELIRREYCK